MGRFSFLGERPSIVHRRRPVSASISSDLKPLDSLRDSLRHLWPRRPLQGTHAGAPPWLTGAVRPSGPAKTSCPTSLINHRGEDRQGFVVPSLEIATDLSGYVGAFMWATARLLTRSPGSRPRPRCDGNNPRSCSHGCSASGLVIGQLMRLRQHRSHPDSSGRRASLERGSAGGIESARHTSSIARVSKAGSASERQTPRISWLHRAGRHSGPWESTPAHVRPDGPSSSRPDARFTFMLNREASQLVFPPRVQRAVASRLASRQRGREAGAARQAEHLAD